MTSEFEPRDETTPDVGQRIRILREARGLSLRTLATLSGLSLNAISRIERGENSPTVASLHVLATALKVPITEFFRDADVRRTVYVRREHRLRSQHDGMEIESLGIGLRDQHLEPFLITLQPGAGIVTGPITHSGQEFVYCVDGSIDYQIGDEVYHLTSGDSLLFEASQPHQFRNISAHPTQILLIFEAQEGTQNAHQQHLDT